MKTHISRYWLRAFVSSWLISAALVVAAGDGLDPAKLLKPLGEEWTSYSGDYSGKRYSTLAQINQSNVKSLSLAWVRKLSGAPSLTGGGGGRRGGGPSTGPRQAAGAPAVIIGGGGGGGRGGGGPP